MARSRDLRPEFFVDEKVGDLPYGARLLFASIWCHSDLRGVFEHSPKQLRVLAFPFDEGLTSDTVGGWLVDLESLGMVVRFEVDGKTWGHVRSWSRHQSIGRSEVEIWTDRPEPPGWVDPPSWAAWIEAGKRSGRRRKRGTISGPSQDSPRDHPRTVPGTIPVQSQGPPQDSHRDCAPSPSPSPSPSTSSTTTRPSVYHDQDFHPDAIPATAATPLKLEKCWMDWRITIGRHRVYLDREGNSETAWANLFNRTGWDEFTKAWEYCAGRTSKPDGKVFLSNLLEVLS